MGRISLRGKLIEKNYFRFQRTPSFESSMTMPFSASSLRIWSARAKLRWLFGLGALGHQGVDGFVGKRLAGKQFRGYVGHAAGLRGPFQGAAGGLGVAVVDHVKDGVEAGQHAENCVAIARPEAAPGRWRCWRRG